MKQTTNYDIHEERFLSRYRYNYLRSGSEVPNSVMNYDRHGMENLKKDKIRPFDRLFGIPPGILFFVCGISIALVLMSI